MPVWIVRVNPYRSLHVIDSCQRCLVTQRVMNWCHAVHHSCPTYRNFRRMYSRFLNSHLVSSIKTSPPWNTLFFGTDEYALPHLRMLNESRKKLRLIDRLEVAVPKIECDVRRYARENQLPVHEWPIPTMTDSFDVGVVVSFGHLIPRRVIDMFPYGILNAHPSLLPRWRGASPIIHTILEGDRETGISIIEIRPIHFDIGPLLLQVKFAVPENATALQLRDYLSAEGASLLVKALVNLPTLEKLEYEQEEYGVTYAHKLSSLNARVNWAEQTMADIDRQYRALSEIHDLRSQWQQTPVKLLDMVPLADMQAEDIQHVLRNVFPDVLLTVRPGIPFYHKSHDILCIRCKDGWVGFEGIRIKKRMSAKSFYNGYLSKPENKSVAFCSLANGLEQFALTKSVHQPLPRQRSLSASS